jgi:hypothetical protein
MEVAGPIQDDLDRTKIDFKTPRVGSKVPSVKSKSPRVGSKSPRVGSKSPRVGSKSPSVGSKVPSVGSKSPSVGSKAPTPRSARSKSYHVRSATLKAVIKGIHEKKNARTTVKNFMDKLGIKKLGIQIRGRFLKSICSDSGVCIAFGKERKKIFDFFNGFSKFDYLKKTRAIGAKSSNGFVKELEYEREGYKAYAILKSSKQQNRR